MNFGLKIILMCASISILILAISTFDFNQSEFNINQERANDLIIKMEMEQMDYEWEQQKHGQWIVDILGDLDWNITFASQELIGNEQNRSIQQNFTKYLRYYHLLKSMYPESEYIEMFEFTIYYWNATRVVDYDVKTLGGMR